VNRIEMTASLLVHCTGLNISIVPIA